jgi:hypothetical protein
MYNNGFKLKNLNNESKRGIRDIYNSWRNYRLSYFTNDYSQYTFFKIFRYLCFYNYIFYCLFGETSKFFRKYKKHSKAIVKLLKNGYCNESILGSIKDFNVIYPKEPEIEDIGIAKLHLEKDYPKIWKLKNDVKEISENRLKLINTLINQNFPLKIEELLKKDDSILYYENIFYEILNEIQNNMDGRHRNLNLGINGDTTLFLGYFEPNQHDILLSTKCDYPRSKEIHEEFKRIINSLITNSELINLVAEYNRESDDFYINDKRTEFFTSIDNLYKDITNNNKMICRKVDCGLEGCANRFMNFMTIFSH